MQCLCVKFLDDWYFFSAFPRSSSLSTFCPDCVCWKVCHLEEVLLHGHMHRLGQQVVGGGVLEWLYWVDLQSKWECVCGCVHVCVICMHCVCNTIYHMECVKVNLGNLYRLSLAFEHGSRIFQVRASSVLTLPLLLSADTQWWMGAYWDYNNTTCRESI